MKIGPLMLDLESERLSVEERLLLSRPSIGGVIFFSRNYENPQQFAALVKEIRQIRPELLLAVDQEGGRVQRFQEGLTRIPAMQRLGDQLESAKNGVDQLIRECGWLMASELLSLGVDFSFAPVLDIDRNRSLVIGDRSFGDSPERVLTAAAHYIDGMCEAGMSATGKHFPGHGAVRLDSHVETPVDLRNYAEVRGSDLVPFHDLGPRLGGVMPAHILYPNIDDQLVGFSEFWLQKILRQEFAFQGAIFSDDLSMKGADCAGGYCDKARAALRAGCDMVLVCNNRAGAEAVLCDLEVNGAVFSSRLKHMRGRGSWDYHELRRSERWRNAVQLLQQMGEEV